MQQPPRPPQPDGQPAGPGRPGRPARGRSGPTRTFGAPAASLTALMALLTVVTGLVEAASLLALGTVFTGMQTGNVLFLAFGTLGEGGLSVVGPATSLGAFVLGALAAARLERRLEAERHRWFVIALLIEAVLVAGAAVTAWDLPPVRSSPTGRHLATIALLAATMGMRNVTAMRVSVPDMPTTLATRAMTAFVAGSALGHDPAFGHARGATARRAGSVVAMFAGGLAGALCIHRGWPLQSLLLTAAALSLLAALARVPQPRLATTR
ncbi:YoaK family protein [Streptomyces sp. NPDC089799]|uniref:YoaK family protein n=1 Tax=Streptomyces sp. NPDC089799 TaxID=3155066 RepID=UPI0034379C5F